MIEERYYETLAAIHAQLQPENYVEIGVRRGDSWRLVGAQTPSIGIDPRPDMRFVPPGDAKMFVGTSDEFFAQHDPGQLLGGPIALAFVDGMHLFEYALRDFANLERHSRPDGTILVHDCFPINAATAGREQSPHVWTGDIWKLIICLKQTRPDLHIEVLDTSPSGMGVITNLNPGATGWREQLDAIIARFIELPYSYLGDRSMMRELLGVQPADDATLQRLFSRERARTTPRDAQAHLRPGTRRAQPDAQSLA
jgi:hypothetical protein